MGFRDQISTTAIMPVTWKDENHITVCQTLIFYYSVIDNCIVMTSEIQKYIKSKLCHIDTHFDIINLFYELMGGSWGCLLAPDQ